MASFRCGQKLAGILSQLPETGLSYEPRNVGDERPFRLALPLGTYGKDAKRLQRNLLNACLEHIGSEPACSLGCCFHARYKVRVDASVRAKQAFDSFYQERINAAIDANNGNCPMCGYDSCGCTCGFCT